MNEPSELPPDPPRLRAILAHLDKQLADTDTVSTYLRLQRAAVQAALTQAETPPPRRRPRAKNTGIPDLTPVRPQLGYVVQQKRTPSGPEPAQIHLDDCTMIGGIRHRIRADEARAALTDPTITPCQFCRPDTELGIDVA